MTKPVPSGPSDNSSRRDFLKVSTVAAAAYLGGIPSVHAGGNDVIRVGLIGCGSPRGGRGRGAATNCVNAGPNVKLVAMADLFKDHLEYTRTYLTKNLGSGKIDVPDKRCFVGWNAYKDLLDCKDVDLVILATPPGFRPLHLKAAVAAGKHVFAEKPVAVDAPGVRSVLKTCAEAKKKNLSIVSGLCWRYDVGMQETFKRIHDCGVGDIVAMQCTYNTGGLWMIPRQSKWTDMEWQVRNWLYFTWLSGDFNVEQHIHSLDKMAWALRDEYPVTAVGLGGRQVRTGPDYGHIFDHHSVVYTYASGIKAFSSCRQQEDCAVEVKDYIFGSKGTCDVMRHIIKGSKSWRFRPSKGQPRRDMYQREHDALIASIRTGKPINNGDYMTKSTLMAIMGRMATYTGQEITWEKALNSREDLAPLKYDFGELPVPPVARPGVTKFI